MAIRPRVGRKVVFEVQEKRNGKFRQQYTGVVVDRIKKESRCYASESSHFYKIETNDKKMYDVEPWQVVGYADRQFSDQQQVVNQ